MRRALLFVCLLAQNADARRFRHRASLSLDTSEKALLTPTECLAAGNGATYFKYGGQGGNAFVLKFKKDCGKFKKGTVAKAFFSEEDQKQAHKDIKSIPKDLPVAGLEQNEDEQMMFKGKCTKFVPEDHKESAEESNNICYFLAMKNGGATTMEQCIEKADQKAANILALAKKSVEVITKIHEAGWHHRDYQTKNIMSKDCQGDSMMAVDLDLMGQHEEGDEAHEAFSQQIRDYEMLFGICDKGGMPLNEYEGMNAKCKACAKVILAKVEAEVCKANKYNDHSQKNNAGVKALAKSIKDALDAVKSTDCPN